MSNANEHGGRIDLHSHLLPGVDDGCCAVEESLACVERLIEAGFVGTVCTPHIWLEQFPASVPANIAQWVTALAAEIQEAGLPYRLWSGGEVRLADNTVRWFKEHGVPTLGEGRCVLIDYWGVEWPRFADEAVDYLLRHGYQPILAHPERMNLPETDMDQLLASLARCGVRLQGNLNSMLGGEGQGARERMERWLAEDRYWVLASDMHDVDGLEARLAAVANVEQLVGAEATSRMLARRPREIVCDDLQPPATQRAAG